YSAYSDLRSFPTRRSSDLGWMDVAMAGWGPGGLSISRNDHAKSFERVPLPQTNWERAYGIAAFDFDNDGWVDLVAVGETKEGKGDRKSTRLNSSHRTISYA